jgi:hypothetical protein
MGLNFLPANNLDITLQEGDTRDVRVDISGFDMESDAELYFQAKSKVSDIDPVIDLNTVDGSIDMESDSTLIISFAEDTTLGLSGVYKCELEYRDGVNILTLAKGKLIIQPQIIVEE